MNVFIAEAYSLNEKKELVMLMMECKFFHLYIHLYGTQNTVFSHFPLAFDFQEFNFCVFMLRSSTEKKSQRFVSESGVFVCVFVFACSQVSQWIPYQYCSFFSLSGDMNISNDMSNTYYIHKVYCYRENLCYTMCKLCSTHLMRFSKKNNWKTDNNTYIPLIRTSAGTCKCKVLF